MDHGGKAMTTRICNVDKNKDNCPCTFSCGKQGICCECIGYHRGKAELPACYFPKDAEKTGDRSVTNFVGIVQKKGTDFLK
jgi:hypothetical protein